MMIHIMHVKLKESKGIPVKEFERIKKEILTPLTAYKAQIIVENFHKLKTKGIRGTVWTCTPQISQLIGYLVNTHLSTLHYGVYYQNTTRIYT